MEKNSSKTDAKRDKKLVDGQTIKRAQKPTHTTTKMWTRSTKTRDSEKLATRNGQEYVKKLRSTILVPTTLIDTTNTTTTLRNGTSMEKLTKIYLNLTEQNTGHLNSRKSPNMCILSRSSRKPCLIKMSNDPTQCRKHLAIEIIELQPIGQNGTWRLISAPRTRKTWTTGSTNG